MRGHHESLQSNYSSYIYAYMRSITGHNSIPEIVSYNGTIAKCDADKASLFNNYFHSVFTTFFHQ